MIRRFFLALALVALPVAGLAHNVISSVFPAGSDIEGEIGFSNGEMAVDLLVEVFDAGGIKLGETMTDQDGFFLYTPTEAVTHVFRADLSAGHVAEMRMPAADVAAIMGVAASEPDPVPEGTPEELDAGTVTIAALTDEERAAIAEIVRREMHPLRQEIMAYKNHNDFQSILGGIGYIVGLFGLGFYLAARRRLAA
ncbi:hypothetical protein [Ectothiorhodospira sp. 9100]|nr:hypothetical protein [Ectothiorhodospira sp. 9100]